MNSEPPFETDVLILGGGVSGIVAAHALKTAGYSIAVVENYDALGGNHKSRAIGPYTFDIGCFLFDPRDYLFSIFPQVLKPCLPMQIITNRLTPSGRVQAYPYDSRKELFGRGPFYAAAAILSLAMSRLLFARQKTAADFAKFHMGWKIYRDSGLERYIERLFGVTGDEIEVAFAQKRLTWIARAGSIRRRMGRSAEPSPSHGVKYVRPKRGFEEIYAPIGQALTDAGVLLFLNTEIFSVKKLETGFEVRTSAGLFKAARLISTIPLQTMAGFLNVEAQGGELKNVDLLTLYYSFSGEKGFDGQILYNFGKYGFWKRITMYSDYYGRVEGREYFGVEIPLREAPDILDRNFRESVSRCELFAGDLKLEGYDITKFAYPVYSAGATAASDLLISKLEALGVESVGRQGRFDYIPTAEKAARQALELLK